MSCQIFCQAFAGTAGAESANSANAPAGFSTRAIHLGYDPAFTETDALPFEHRIMQQLYPRYFGLKQWLKVNTILGSLVSMDRMHLSR
jgi:hypothetical protein